jgi:CRP-like cAMP-binding protein
VSTTAPADPVRPLTLAELRSVDLFDGLDDDELARWLAVAQVYELGPGGIFAEQGEHARGLQLLLEGDARTLLISDGRTEPLGTQHGPTWLGAIAVLTGGTLGVRMQTTSPCRMALIPSADTLDLVMAQRTVHRTIMQQISPVMSRITAIEQNRERLAGLGTMAAGLAHELNTPAAAATRGPPTSPTPWRSSARRSGTSWRRASSASRHRSSSGCSARRSPTPGPAAPSTCWTRPTPRTP